MSGEADARLIRVGLTQRVEVVAGYNERRDCLDQEWAALLVQMGYWPVPLANRVEDVEGYFSALGLAGVILTGGNDPGTVAGGCNIAPERDRFEHAVIATCARRHLPVLGICRGMQIINLHFGGHVAGIPGHVAHRHRVRHDPAVTSAWLATTEVNSFHNFGILASGLGKSLRPVAWAEDGTVEALEHEILPFVGVMWHPERESPPSGNDLSLIRAIWPHRA